MPAQAETCAGGCPAQSASGSCKLDRDSGIVRFVVLCDSCGAEMLEVGRARYRPDPDLSGAREGAARPGRVVSRTAG